MPEPQARIRDGLRNRRKELTAGFADSPKSVRSPVGVPLKPPNTLTYASVRAETPKLCVEDMRYSDT